MPQTTPMTSKYLFSFTRLYSRHEIHGNNRSTRVEFTPEDERNLVNWLALRMPYPEHPRMGNKEYKDLCKYASVGTLPPNDLFVLKRHCLL